MRNFLTQTRRRVTTAWLWPLILLALPGCFLDSSPYDSLPEAEIFNPGSAPLTGLIMCDIPKVWVEGDECASDDDVLNQVGMPSTEAAVALNAGTVASDTVLDWSDAAVNACNGKPRKTKYYGPYPNGYEVCLNCETQIGQGKIYKTATDACVAKCQDLVGQDEGQPAEGAAAFCQERAHVSVNFNVKCFEGFCTTGGMPIGTGDPRINPEFVEWTLTDLDNTTLEDGGLTLKFFGPGNGTFGAGAAGGQLITEGDAWVEFEAGETGVSHAIAVRSCSSADSCPDDDNTLGDLPLLLNLNVDNAVNVVENGTTVLYTDPAPYAAKERFRIRVTDNHDKTASISFSRLDCSSLPCTETTFFPVPLGTPPTAAYPLRIDTSFREGPATFKNVTVMRIIKK